VHDFLDFCLLEVDEMLAFSRIQIKPASVPSSGVHIDQSRGRAVIMLIWLEALKERQDRSRTKLFSALVMTKVRSTP
jgi:hypothetical protein